MYRVLLLVLSLVAFSQQRHRGTERNQESRFQHRADRQLRNFEDVANTVIASDRTSQQLCAANSNGATKEFFESNRYSLKTPLEGFSAADVSVQIRHRVVYINAYKADSAKHYVEVKELPAFVNVNQATYTLKDGFIKVVFPTRNSIQNDCNPSIMENIISVPRI